MTEESVEHSYPGGEKLSWHYDAMFDVGLDTDEEEDLWMRKSDTEHPDGIHELDLAKDIILFRRRRKEKREARREVEGSQRPVSTSDDWGRGKKVIYTCPYRHARDQRRGRYNIIRVTSEELMAVTRGRERGRLDLLPWNCPVGGSKVFVFVGPVHDFGEHLNHRVIDWEDILTPPEISQLFTQNSFLVMLSTGDVAGMCGNASFSFHDALVLQQTGLQALNGYDRYGDIVRIVSLPITTTIGSCAGVAAMVVPKRLVPWLESAEWSSIISKSRIVGIHD